MVNFYLNWFDLAISIFLAVLIWRGLKYGFIIQFLVNVGFFGGLFFGGWIFPYILPIKDPTILAITNGCLVLFLAVAVGYLGFRLGSIIHYSIGKKWPFNLESAISIVLSLVSGLVAVWLMASTIGRLPFEGLSNSANDAYIVQYLDQHLPPIPAVIAVLGTQINPNSLPQVYTRTNFTTEILVSNTKPAIKAAALRAERSVVRITSFGCGGIVSGSGFAIAPNLVMTNAHVIAGVRRPIVKFGTKSFEATPVLFDSGSDIAVLRIPGLDAVPMELVNTDVTPGTIVVTLGFPNGNYTALPGVIIDEQHDYSDNIYSLGKADRLIYEVQVAVSEGSSGGPVLLWDGRVVGVIYAESATVKSHGFALASSALFEISQRAERSYRRVSTGVCLSS